jgi:hypothetical protein
MDRLTKKVILSKWGSPPVLIKLLSVVTYKTTSSSKRKVSKLMTPVTRNNLTEKSKSSYL